MSSRRKRKHEDEQNNDVRSTDSVHGHKSGLGTDDHGDRSRLETNLGKLKNLHEISQ